MKKILLINLFVLTVVYSLGQSNVYHPFPDSNAVWVIDWSYYNGYHWVYEYYNLFVSGDTVIGNYSYHKLYKNGGLYQDHLNPSQSVSEYYHRYSGAFRQDSLNRKIYCYDDEDACDTLAYDFNLNVGDSLPLTYLYASYMNVISIDSILVGDHYNKRFWLGDNMCSNVSELIEGVGSSFGAFVFVGCYFECSSFLRCVKVNGETIYPMNSGIPCDLINQNHDIKTQNQINISPNPFSNCTFIRTSINLKNAYIIVYDIFGREVKSLENVSGQIVELQRDNLSSGVYLIRLIQENRIITQQKIIISN